MPRITVNGVPFTGQIGPVTFDQGEGHTEVPSMLAHFRRDPERYTVHEDEQPEEPEGEPDPYDVNVSELRKLASSRELSTAGTKAELQERLRAADTAE